MERLGKRGPIPRSIVERIAAKVVVDEGGCHIWQGATSMKGYPQIQTGSMADGTRRPRRAHRVLYQALHGPLSQGVDVHHTCGNKLCLNPEHLTSLSHAEHSLVTATSRTSFARGPNTKRYPKECEGCGDPFSANRIDQTYCSEQCRVNTWKRANR